MSIVLVGSTSGSCTLQEQAIAGTTVLTLPTTSGTILTTASSGQSIPKAALPAGTILQVAQGTFNTYTTSTSTSYIDSGLSVSITPTSSSSKILIFVSQFLMIAGGNQGLDCYLNIVRNSTQVWETLQQAINTYATGGAAVEVGTFICLNYLDSPATTSAITYKTQVRKGTGSEIRWRAATIIAMEVAA
jgi:hypothetical protein